MVGFIAVHRHVIMLIIEVVRVHCSNTWACFILPLFLIFFLLMLLEIMVKQIKHQFCDQIIDRFYLLMSDYTREPEVNNQYHQSFVDKAFHDELNNTRDSKHDLPSLLTHRCPHDDICQTCSIHNDECKCGHDLR